MRHNPSSDSEKNESPIDTTGFVILPFDSSYYNLSGKSPATLSIAELKTLDSLFIPFVADDEGHFAKDSIGHPKIDLSKNHYKKQYIAFLDEKGEKKVWVNCFCSAGSDWRNEIVEVEDGGDCYFNLVINLSDNSYSFFYVNGEA